jgi:hypothetical protein
VSRRLTVSLVAIVPLVRVGVTLHVYSAAHHHLLSGLRVLYGPFPSPSISIIILKSLKHTTAQHSMTM